MLPGLGPRTRTLSQATANHASSARHGRGALALAAGCGGSVRSNQPDSESGGREADSLSLTPRHVTVTAPAGPT